MAAGEGSARVGLCPTTVHGSPHPAAAGTGVQVRTPCKEEKAARFEQRGHPKPTCVCITAGLHWQGSEAAPDSVSPSTSGLPVVQSAASAAPVPELCGDGGRALLSLGRPASSSLLNHV